MISDALDLMGFNWKPLVEVRAACSNFKYGESEVSVVKSAKFILNPLTRVKGTRTVDNSIV